MSEQPEAPAEFNVAEEIIADLSQQVAEQAKQIAFLRTAIKQRDQLLAEQRPPEVLPNRAARRSKKDPVEA